MSWDATVLSRNDSVATALRPVAAGATVRVMTPDGIIEVVARQAIPLCHKIAVSELASGQDVFKYGACIGAARMAIPRGAWIHVHNIVSKRALPKGSRS